MAILNSIHIGNVNTISLVEWTDSQEDAKERWGKYKIACNDAGEIWLCKDKSYVPEGCTLIKVNEITKRILQKGAPDTEKKIESHSKKSLGSKIKNLWSKTPFGTSSSATSKSIGPHPKIEKSESEQQIHERPKLPLSNEEPEKMKQKEPVEQFSLSNVELEKTMHKAIANSQAQRAKLNYPEIKAMEVALEPLDKAVELYFMLLKEKNTQAAEAQLKKLKNIYNEIGKKNSSFEKLGMAIYLLGFPQGTCMLYQAYRESVIRSASNAIKYKEEVIKNVQDNLQQICKTFFNIDDTHSVTFDLGEKTGGETHNEGKSPWPITFMQNGHAIGQLMYKPRDALIDIQVIELFKKLNRYEGSPRQFPTYDIISLNSNASMWEFIEGKTVKELVNIYGRKHIQQNLLQNPSLTIRGCIEGLDKSKNLNSPFTKEKIIKLLEKLNILDTIFTEIKIGDLHAENVMIRGFNTDNPEIVVIDLENLQLGTADFTTCLGGICNIDLLNEHEKKILIDFKNLDLPSRFIILGTQGFVRLHTEFNNTIDLQEEILEQLESENFIMTILPEELLELLCTDFLNGDFPYFSESQGVLYYGAISEAHAFAKRGEK